MREARAESATPARPCKSGASDGPTRPLHAAQTLLSIWNGAVQMPALAYDGGMRRLAISTLAVLALAAVAVGLAMAAHSPHESPAAADARRSADDTTDLLRGTWLRDYTVRGTHVRRVMHLDADGRFHETVRVVEPSGTATEYVHEGNWLFDGTNLKRHYTLMNGKPPSRLNVPFATFQIAFSTRNHFTGVDHVHDHRVEYERVPDETAP